MEFIIVAVIAAFAWGVYSSLRQSDRAGTDSGETSKREVITEGGLEELDLRVEISINTSPEEERARQLFKDATAASYREVITDSGLEELGFRAEISINTNPEEERARQLFKDATAASYEDSARAVVLFHEACEQAALSGRDFGIDVFLRLPRYLQECGRSDEGWREFNNLLTTGYPNMPEGDRNQYYREAAIYDKMRLFLQREKRFATAVTFGAKSIIRYIRAMLTEPEELNPLPQEPLSDYERRWVSEARLHREEHRQAWRQNDLKEAAIMRDPERLNDQLTKLLRRAKLLDHREDALAVLCEWANAQPNSDDLEYERRFNRALGFDH